MGVRAIEAKKKAPARAGRTLLLRAGTATKTCNFHCLVKSAFTATALPPPHARISAMIVSCGEALIDFLPLAVPGGPAGFAPHVGGSPFNVAVALGRLGGRAGFLGGLSRDLFGEMLAGALHAAGVDTTLACFSDRPTTLAFVTVVNGDARYAFFDEGSAGHMLTGADLPALPKTVTALHFGSFSLAEEPCGSAFEALMQGEQNERVISLDINVRPAL